MADDLENMITRTVERLLAARYQERHGLVTSYDSKKHLAKVKFMPEGQESGWLPIETGLHGNGYGMAMGLTPGSGDGGGGQGGGGGQQGESGGGSGGGGGGSGGGGDGGQQNQYQGDHVIVRYQEGDVESGKISRVVHSDKDKPPEVKSGEMVFWTSFKKQDSSHSPGSAEKKSTGCKIHFKNDGSLSFTDGTGATHTFDGKGNIKTEGKKNTEEYKDAVSVKTEKGMAFNAKNNIDVKAQQTLSLDGSTVESSQPIQQGDTA